MKHATPKDWSTTTLGDIAEIVMGTSPPGEDIAESEGGLPFIQGNAEFGVRHPKPALWCRSPLRTAVAGDLLVSVRAPVGEMNEADQTLCIGRGLAAVRVGNGAKAFVWHALGREIRQLQRVAQGSTFTAVNREDIEEIVLPLPPPAEQAKIAAVLGAVDEAVERSRAVLAQTKTLRQALLHTLLTRGLPGRHTKFKTVKPFGRVPTDWTLPTIGDVFEVRLGKMLSEVSKTGKASRPYLGNVAVQWERCNVADLPVMDFDADEVAKFELRPGDLLVCEGGEVGRTAIWRGEVPGCCYQKAIHRLRPLAKNILPEYFLYFMRLATDRQYFRIYTTRSSIAHLTRETLVDIVLPLPPTEEQRAIVQAIEGVPLAAASAHLAQLERVKSALSAALLTGEVRVPVDCLSALATAPTKGEVGHG